MICLFQMAGRSGLYTCILTNIGQMYIIKSKKELDVQTIIES